MERYLRATGVFSLALFSVSAAFLFEPSRVVTAVSLVPMTILFGFVAYISREGFSEESLAAAPTLLLGLAGPVVGLAALAAAVASPLVSVFTGGDSFRDYFGAVSMPLLVTGLVLGGAAYVAVDGSQQLEQRAMNLTSQEVGSRAATIVRESGFRERFQQSQVRLVRTSSEASVALTGQYIRNASLDAQASAKVVDSLREAQREVPERVSSGIENATDQSVNIENQLEGSLRDALEGRMPVVAFPIVAGLVYASNPVVGLLVGLWASIFSRVIPEGGS